jgi:hypothetical protein
MDGAYNPGADDADAQRTFPLGFHAQWVSLEFIKCGGRQADGLQTRFDSKDYT